MARTRSVSLTDAEARIMAVLWAHPHATVAEVVTALKPTRAVTYSTAQTMLRILEDKGYVTHEKVGRAFHYRPVVAERQARQHALRHLVDRLFGGSPSLLVLNVLDDERLDPGELRRLKQLIDRA